MRYIHGPDFSIADTRCRQVHFAELHPGDWILDDPDLDHCTYVGKVIEILPTRVQWHHGYGETHILPLYNGFYWKAPLTQQPQVI